MPRNKAADVKEQRQMAVLFSWFTIEADTKSGSFHSGLVLFAARDVQSVLNRLGILRWAVVIHSTTSGSSLLVLGRQVVCRGGSWEGAQPYTETGTKAKSILHMLPMVPTPETLHSTTVTMLASRRQ